MARTGRSSWERVAHVRPARAVRRLAGQVETFQVERFGRSLVSVLFRTPVLVLHTTGRRTGAVRSTPLAFAPAAPSSSARTAPGGSGGGDTSPHRGDDVGRSFLVVGGAGGQARVPDWVGNLRADGRAAITVGRERLSVRAVELLGDERAETWEVLRRRWPRIDTYELRAGRAVPVFRFDTVSESDFDLATATAAVSETGTDTDTAEADSGPS